MKKIILTLAGFCILFSDAFGQEIEWQNTIGGSDNDQLYSIQQTTDGGYILGGWSPSDISGDKTENSNGMYDYWIIKTDSFGNIQWQNTIGGNNWDVLQYIRQTSDGGYIMCGYSKSGISGDKTENCIGSEDYWVVKTDASGNIQWENTIGGDSLDWATSVSQTIDGGYIIGGYSWSNISGDKTENRIGMYDYWILKTDSLGNIQWQNTIGGTGNDILYSTQQTSDGGYILGGYSWSNISGDKTENCNGDYDYWIVKTDSLGNIQWQNTIGGNGEDRLYSLQQTADKGYILGGESYSGISGDKTENNRDVTLNTPDYWIVKTDSLGNIQWQRTIGGDKMDELYCVQQTTDGGYILGGWSSSNISGDKTENCIGLPNYWVVKTDSTGDILWQNTLGGNIGEELLTLQQTADGGYILGGWSSSNISGDKTENCMGVADYWIVKLTDHYNLIEGKLFVDFNSNNAHDAGEPFLQNKTVTEINTGRFGFSQQNGSFKVVVLDSGNFTVYPPAINYYSTVPANHTVYFNGIQQTDSLNDFAFQPTGVFNDLCVTITPMGNFRANMNASYMINYENVGTTTLNGTVIFFPDNDVTFVSANPIATSVTTDSIVWNVGTLAPFQTGSILVTVHVNAGTPAGTLINSSVEIDPVAGDANTACNYNAWEVFTTGAVDPNAIIVDRETVLTTELSSPPYLNYIIYFQNTGNDTAFNVKVLNPIDTFKLDIHSFEFVASSHPVNINYKIWERNMEFTFDNILLPDSNINEPASHGFILFRIKPLSTLTAGDQIKNNAAIYFDFNQPVLTDTALTNIVLPNGIDFFNLQSSIFNIFPNPANGLVGLNFMLEKNADVKIEVFNSFGQKIKTVLNEKLKSGKQEITYDATKYFDGIYLVKMIIDGEMTVRKMVKM